MGTEPCGSETLIKEAIFMFEHLTMDELVVRVLAELKRLAYAQNTQLAYRRFYNRVLHLKFDS